MSLQRRLARIEAARPEPGGYVLNLSSLPEGTLAEMAEAYGDGEQSGQEYGVALMERITAAKASGTFLASLSLDDLEAILHAADAAKGAVHQ